MDSDGEHPVNRNCDSQVAFPSFGRLERAALVVRWIVLLGAVLTLSVGCKYVDRLLPRDAGPERSRASAAEGPAPLVVPGPGLAAGVRYRITRLTVTATNRLWDKLSSPDLLVTMFANDQKIGSCKSNDEYTIVCTPNWEFDLEADTVLAIEVVDRDTVGEDAVGGGLLASLTGAGATHVELPMTPSGGVARATVTLVSAPSFWARNRAHLLALAIGIGGALLLILLFHRPLFAPEHYWIDEAEETDSPPQTAVAPPVHQIVVERVQVVEKVRCSFCGALADTTATTCTECGGKL